MHFPSFFLTVIVKLIQQKSIEYTQNHPETTIECTECVFWFLTQWNWVSSQDAPQSFPQHGVGGVSERGYDEGSRLQHQMEGCFPEFIKG